MKTLLAHDLTSEHAAARQLVLILMIFNKTSRAYGIVSCLGVQIEAADKIAQAAATTVLRAIPELQMALKDIGSSNRDGSEPAHSPCSNTRAGHGSLSIKGHVMVLLAVRKGASGL